MLVYRTRIIVNGCYWNTSCSPWPIHGYLNSYSHQCQRGLTHRHTQSSSSNSPRQDNQWTYQHRRPVNPVYNQPNTLAWLLLSSVLRPRQHSIGYMGDGFYRSKDPTNSIKVLKEKATKEKANNENNKTHKCTDNNRNTNKISTTSPLVYTNMGWLGDSSHRGQGH